MEQIKAFKAAASLVIAALTALWGWFGWFVVLWAVCMVIDYVTGTCAALRRGEWSSQVARDGLWHKLGCITAVLVAGILDGVIGYLINTTGVELPFTYTVLVCPLVVAWYVLTELGSIIENAGALGAPLPKFLTGAVAALKDAVDAAGDISNGS